MQCIDRTERDRLLQFVNVLLLNRRNVKLFIDAGGVRCLVDLVTLAHGHTTRAVQPTQTNLLEASAEQKAQDAEEWFYAQGKDTKDKQGPIGLIKVCVAA